MRCTPPLPQPFLFFVSTPTSQLTKRREREQLQTKIRQKSASYGRECQTQCRRELGGGGVNTSDFRAAATAQKAIIGGTRVLRFALQEREIKKTKTKKGANHGTVPQRFVKGCSSSSSTRVDQPSSPTRTRQTHSVYNHGSQVYKARGYHAVFLLLTFAKLFVRSLLTFCYYLYSAGVGCLFIVRTYARTVLSVLFRCSAGGAIKRKGSLFYTHKKKKSKLLLVQLFW